jgi:hypothetical protein
MSRYKNCHGDGSPNKHLRLKNYLIVRQTDDEHYFWGSRVFQLPKSKLNQGEDCMSVFKEMLDKVCKRENGKVDEETTQEIQTIKVTRVLGKEE